MVDKYTTIADLPRRTESERYAAAESLKQQIGKTLDTRVLDQTTVDSTTPYSKSSEFDYLFGSTPLTHPSSKASIAPPENYNISTCYKEALLIPFFSQDTLETLQTQITQKKEQIASSKEINSLEALFQMLQEKNKDMFLFQSGYDKYKRG